MTPKLLELLKAAIAKGDSTTFIEDENTLYARFDSINIRPKESTERGFFGAKKYISNYFIIEFQLGEDITKELEIGPIYFSGGDSLALKDINGLFRIEVADNNKDY